MKFDKFLRKCYDWFYMKIQNTKEYYEKYGMWKSILHFFERIGLGYRKRSLLFFELDLQDCPLLRQFEDRGELVKIEKEDLATTDEYFDGWFHKDQALGRLEAGHILLVMKQGERMIFFQWFEFGKVKIPFLELTFPIPDKTACMAYIYTIPEFRGKGTASKAKPPALNYLYTLGYQKVFLAISPKNQISQKVNRKVGFKAYQLVTLRKFSILKYYSVQDYHTKQKKIFWRHKQIQHCLWNAYSKIDTI